MKTWYKESIDSEKLKMRGIQIPQPQTQKKSIKTTRFIFSFAVIMPIFFFVLFVPKEQVQIGQPAQIELVGLLDDLDQSYDFDVWE